MSFVFPGTRWCTFVLLRVLSHVHTNVKLAFLLPFNFRCSRCDPTLSIFLSGFVFTPFTFVSFDLRCNCICDCCLHLSLFRRLIHANSRPRSFSAASRQLSYCVRNFFLKKTSLSLIRLHLFCCQFSVLWATLSRRTTDTTLPLHAYS